MKGVTYPESKTIDFISLNLLHILLYNGEKATLSCIFAGVTWQSKTKFFLSQAVWKEYANTRSRSPLWKRPQSGSVLLIFISLSLTLLVSFFLVVS